MCLNAFFAKSNAFAVSADGTSVEESNQLRDACLTGQAGPSQIPLPQRASHGVDIGESINLLSIWEEQPTRARATKSISSLNDPFPLESFLTNNMTLKFVGVLSFYRIDEKRIKSISL